MSVHMPAMELARLAPQFFTASEDQLMVTGLTADSRQIEPGQLFVALRGYGRPGSDFAEDAVRAGAVAVISDLPQIRNLNLGVPVALDANLAQNLSAMAGEFYCHPSHSLDVIGITGTNGKTSCCYWLSWLLNELGVRCGHIGTLGAGMVNTRSGELQPFRATGFTTPDPIQVQRLLAECAADEARAVVMEVSSHGLDQGRVAAVRFDAALFTNFSQDHLDYHADMEAYLQAKMRLFKQAGLQRAIVNLDEAVAGRILASLDTGVVAHSYSLADTDADLYFTAVQPVAAGYQVRLDGRWGAAELSIPVVGRYNLSNLLAVATVLLARGVTLADLAPLLERLPSVPGRMQRIAPAGPKLPTVIVDFAHTPDALASALAAMREQTRGKLIAVLGCGGDRDKGKRPLMAQMAVDYSDRQFFTSDNPRNETPGAILDDMLAGVPGAGSVEVIADRRAAIEAAILSAQPGDLVAVLGKGHESYQIIGDRRLEFSDASVCAEILRGRLAP